MDVFDQIEALVTSILKKATSYGRYHPMDLGASNEHGAQLRQALALRSRVHFLFGNDISEYHERLIDLYFGHARSPRLVRRDPDVSDRVWEQRVRQRYQMSPSDHEARVREVADSLELSAKSLADELTPTFEPYLGRDQLVGLSFRHRTELWRQSLDADRDPTLLPVSAYVPGADS